MNPSNELQIDFQDTGILEGYGIHFQSTTGLVTEEKFDSLYDYQVRSMLFNNCSYVTQKSFIAVDILDLNLLGPSRAMCLASSNRTTPTLQKWGETKRKDCLLCLRVFMKNK